MLGIQLLKCEFTRTCLESYASIHLFAHLNISPTGNKLRNIRDEMIMLPKVPSGGFMSKHIQKSIDSQNPCTWKQWTNSCFSIFPAQD